ncbi:MAG: Sulfurtransferase [Gammaproteobacteria bacterium]|nr:Sulfurtransferase [Gammaproteobacteria bacterium]
MYTTLIEAEALARELADSSPAANGNTPGWAILDCRFDLSQPEWGGSAYAAGHLPNALYAHLDRDLSGPRSPATGRHPLPAIARLAETFGRWGIDEKVQVVAYDQGNGAYAARLWWLLRWAGHLQVAVLNGGFAAWQQAGLPVETAPGTCEPRTFVPRPTQPQNISTAELERLLRDGALASGESMLVDARGADRFAGENETIDPVAGHIPGAHSHPFARNLDAQGRFLPASELRERWQATLGEHPAQHAIAMCGSGVTACHNLLALEIAGLSGARLYAGSWSEWIREGTRPVARGLSD